MDDVYGVEFCKRPRNATVGKLKFADRTELRLYNASAEIVIGKSIKVSLENLGRVEGVKEFGNAVGSFESARMKGAIGLAPGGAFLRELCGVLPAVVASLSIPRRHLYGEASLGGPGIPLESPTEESYWKKTQARCRLYLGEGDDVFVELRVVTTLAHPSSLSPMGRAYAEEHSPSESADWKEENSRKGSIDKHCGILFQIPADSRATIFRWRGIFWICSVPSPTLHIELK